MLARTRAAVLAAPRLDLEEEELGTSGEKVGVGARVLWQSRARVWAKLGEARWLERGSTHLGVDDLLGERGDASDDPLASLHLLADDAGSGKEVMGEADVESRPHGDGRVASREEESEVALGEAVEAKVNIEGW
jgi:hypothetical protein